jgi:hypothetical protein
MVSKPFGMKYSIYETIYMKIFQNSIQNNEIEII